MTHKRLFCSPRCFVYIHIHNTGCLIILRILPDYKDRVIVDRKIEIEFIYLLQSRIFLEIKLLGSNSTTQF